MYAESVDDDDNDDDDDCDEAAADDDLGCDDDVVVPTMNLNKSYVFLGPLWAGEGPPPPSGPDVVAVAFSPVMDAEKVFGKDARHDLDKLNSIGTCLEAFGWILEMSKTIL